MKYLLDTHIWLWWTAGSARITEALKEKIQDPANDVFLSVASAWEIAIKYRIGKLRLTQDPSQLIASETATQNISLIDIRLQHATKVSTLPLHHHDPFDRLIIAQSIIEGCVLVTADQAITPYEVDVLFLQSK